MTDLETITNVEFTNEDYQKIGSWFENQVKSQENYTVALKQIINEDECSYTFSARLVTALTNGVKY